MPWSCSFSLHKPFLNELASAGSDLVALPGAKDYAAPTLALQFRTHAFGNEVISEPTCHPGDSEPDRALVNLEQRLELRETQAESLDFPRGSTSNDRVEMRLYFEENARRHMPPQIRNENVDESGVASLRGDIHGALTLRILQGSPGAKFD